MLIEIHLVLACTANYRFSTEASNFDERLSQLALMKVQMNLVVSCVDSVMVRNNCGA